MIGISPTYFTYTVLNDEKHVPPRLGDVAGGEAPVPLVGAGPTVGAATGEVGTATGEVGAATGAAGVATGEAGVTTGAVGGTTVTAVGLLTGAVGVTTGAAGARIFTAKDGDGDIENGYNVTVGIGEIVGGMTTP